MDKNSIVHQEYINTEYAIVIKKKKEKIIYESV